MVKKVHYTWKDIEHMIVTINNLMFADNWRPDYIVGMTRGGLVPAVIMSNTTGIPMHALDVRFRDTDENYVGPESNAWMAEHAYEGKKILRVDDINDSGNTLNWIKQDWMSCCPDDKNWDTIWGGNVRVATLMDNAASEFEWVDYTAMEIDKREDPTWIVFPWEGERDYGNF